MTSELLFTGPELCKFEAHEVVALLKAIAQTGPLINATPTLCEARARAVDLSSRDSTPAGWLAGLPITIKDLNAVANVRTTFGTKGLAGFIPQKSDPLVDQLEQRGAVILGKTNTPEFGAGGNTFNDVFGQTRNPWNTALNPGGSSGGAAASLAAGSLRTPAAYCGIVGLRPSPGIAGGPGQDAAFIIEGVQGPMARSVRDCALFLDAMSGFDPQIAISYPAPEIPYQEAVIRADGKLKIAFAPDLGGFGQVDPEMAQHLAAAMRQLEKNGARIEETCPDLTHLERSYHTLRGLMWATAAKRLPQEVQAHFKSTLAENTAFGQALTLEDIIDANLNRSILFNNMLSLFETFDVLACPTVGCMPHSASEEWGLRFAFLATTTGLPAISVPVGRGPRGLPVGLQLIGKPRGEAALLAAARHVELTFGGPLGPIDPINPS